MGNIFYILIAVLGEILLITANIIFGEDLPKSIIFVNCIFSSIAFLLVVSPLFIKKDRSDDKVGQWVGYLGISIQGTFLYVVFTALAIFFMNSQALATKLFSEAFATHIPVPVGYQLMVHGVLLIILLFTFGASKSISNQVEHVYVKEQHMVAGLDQMKSSLRKLQDQAFITQGISPDVRQQIDSMQEELRFLSPIGQGEATELEMDFVEKVNALIPAFINYKMNEEAIRQQIKLLARIIENRKNVKL